MPELSLREAVRAALREELIADERFFLLGEDIGAYGGAYGVTGGLLEEFGPSRVVDTPVSEAGIVGAAVGGAMAGLRPCVELMRIDFGMLAMDQIVSNAAALHWMSGGQITVPLVIRCATGGGLGTGPQYSHSLEGWFASVPGLKVICPSNAYEAKGLLRTAFRDVNPVLCMEHAGSYERRCEVPEGDYSIPFGVANVARIGSDVTVVAYGGAVATALSTAEVLASEGIEIEVIDLRTLRPLDVETVAASVRKTGRALVVEEGWRTGGFGAEIVASIQEGAFGSLKGPVGRVAGLEVPMPYAAGLERAAVPDAGGVVAAVRGLMGRA